MPGALTGKLWTRPKVKFPLDVESFNRWTWATWPHLLKNALVHLNIKHS